MPYLPPDFLHDTEFPLAYGKDVHLMLRLLRESYDRFYPKIDYEAVLAQPVVATSPEDPVAESGQSGVDLVWGEVVPTTLAGQDWEQPHLNASHDAVAVEVYRAAVSVPFRVRRDNKEKDLKKEGFDPVRDVTGFIPTVVLDELGITCRPGDRFNWDGDYYVVKWAEATGYWKMTNLRLFVELVCEHQHQGS